jgi:hypothetical protein
MPARPRGDKKERTFNLLIRDGIEPQGTVKEELLIGSEPDDDMRGFSDAEDIAGEFRQLFGNVLDDHYVVGGEGRGSVRFLFPFHSVLPGSYKFYGQYKMFNGKILAFLCQPMAASAGFNKALIDRFYDLFNGTEGLTLLDQTALELARETAGVTEESVATSDVLVRRHYPDQEEGPGALLPAAHVRFQDDLETVLGVGSLNRRDLVSAAMNLFYVHLALYFQRLAWLLDEEFSLSLEAMIDPTIRLDHARSCFAASWEESPFAGAIEFRVASGRSEPVRMTDGCVTSYREQLRRQLLLPANLSVLGAARKVMSACGQAAERWSFADLAAACRSDTALANAFNEAMADMAVATVADRPDHDREDIARQVAAGSQGLEVFREALLKSHGSALRRHGRDIVHGLVHRGGRGYIASRGRSLFFFEIGQDLLLLLAKVIVKDRQVPFRQFVEELRRYGFAAQTHQQQDRLAETLRSLNLLEKHSDAGEAMYVKHFL